MRNEKELLNILGSWTKPSITPNQETVQAFLDEIARNTQPMSQQFIWNRAVAASFATLTRKEYFSEIGRKLLVRQLAEAILLAPDIDACQTLEGIITPEKLSFATILTQDIYRDGGSLEICALLSDKTSLTLFLQIGPNAEKPHGKLYPCDPSKVREFLPIPKHSYMERWITIELERCIRECLVSPQVQINDLKVFLHALAERVDSTNQGYSA